MIKCFPAILLPLLLVAAEAADPIGKISFPLNRVFVIPAGSSELRYAEFNMPVYSGDKIETRRQSRCEITLNNGEILRVDENSIFTLDQYLRDDGEVNVRSTLSIGRIWANIKKIFSGDDYFTVKSPSAVIAVRGTIYRVDAEEDTTTQVRVYDGEVEVSPNLEAGGKAASGAGWTGAPREVQAPTEVAGPAEVSMETWVQMVTARHEIVVRRDGSFDSGEFDAADDGDLDWVRWNRQRDALLAQEEQE